MEEFLSRCRQAAEYLAKRKRVTVIGHRDADGICASVILKEGFAESDVDIRIIRHSTDLGKLAEECKGALAVFVDYGSSEIESIENSFDDFLILDHHPSVRPHAMMVNPWEYGIDGTRELSGAGVSYFVAREHNGGNRALSNLAIIGAMGDKMHLSGFKGPNSTILEDARNVGIIEDGGAYEDILVHGLRFSNDGESALKVANIIDSCASVNRPEVAVEMLAGNMRAFETAMVLYDDYRRRYDAQMDAIMSNWERISKENSQHLAYFVYLSEVEPGFTGVLAEELVLRFTDKPVVVVSKAPYGLKASARSTMRQITETGIDLGRAMSEASSYCGGRGGGHDVAAGASFREDQLEEFKSLTTLGLFSQWRSRLKMRFELVTDGQKESASLASSLAVDNERYGSTTSMAIPQGNKIYIMVTSEDIGTFKNTVDDLIVCLTSIKDLVGTGMDHHDI